MALLKPAQNTTAFAKIGIQGFAGSGKTFTAGLVASGLAKLQGLTPPPQVAMLDTEKGSDFLLKPLKKQGVDLLVHKGRAFTDLLAIIREAEQAKIPVLIVDSITHIWRDLVDSYMKRTNKKFMAMQDWGLVKGQWKEFTDLFINSRLHILMLGRAGHEYEDTVNEDTGKREFVKSGTKMKVEGETGFEPDLVLEMERVQKDDGTSVNRAWVFKDRSDTLNGKYFDKPNFATFKPFFDFINIGGEHKGVDTTRDSQEVFENPDRSFPHKLKQREIALERLNETLVLAGLTGTAKKDAEERTKELIRVFGTSSKTEIEGLWADSIYAGIEKIKAKYADRFKDPGFDAEGPTTLDDVP